jgi:hypothetical protein
MSDESHSELFSTRVQAGSRTYFFDLKQSQDGGRYLTISELCQGKAGKEHHRVMVFEEHIKAFRQALTDALSRIAEPEGKSYSVEVIRKEYPNAYAAWSDEDDQRLCSLYEAGCDINELAGVFHRKPDAIQSRLRKLAARQRWQAREDGQEDL